MGSLRVGHDLSNFTFTFHFHALEEEMATHSSVLAWRIPGTVGAWWAAVYGVTQSRTRLKWLSSSSSSSRLGLSMWIWNKFPADADALVQRQPLGNQRVWNKLYYLDTTATTVFLVRDTRKDHFSNQTVLWMTSRYYSFVLESQLQLNFFMFADWKYILRRTWIWQVEVESPVSQGILVSPTVF